MLMTNKVKYLSFILLLILMNMAERAVVKHSVMCFVLELLLGSKVEVTAASSEPRGCF